MPNYGIPQSGSQLPPNQGLNLAVINPGDSIVLFNAESPAAPQPSVAFARGVGPMNIPAGIVFTISFAAAPTDSLVIQGSNQDIDSQYQTLYTSTNKQTDFYADLGEFLFYRAKLVSQSAGGAVTVIAQR
jgi:hypothetical protein